MLNLMFLNNPVRHVETESRVLATLLQCCGSQSWATQMMEHRPFESEAQLFETAQTLWRGLTPQDWLEAFSHHPRIGDLESIKARFSASQSSGWEAGEQSSAANASTQTLEAIAQGNLDYEARFGFIFLICATGKSAEQMLTVLKERMSHTREQELTIAAGEQEQITRLRLIKWLGGKSV